MGVPALYVWTHDSIGVGEDGPTHQPIEHLSSLRAIPGFDVVRPADANETAVAWRTILEKSDRPAGIVLSRQNLPSGLVKTCTRTLRVRSSLPLRAPHAAATSWLTPRAPGRHPDRYRFRG